MRRSQSAFILWIVVGVSLAGAVRVSVAQPKISREQISSTIPSGVRKQIERLYDHNAKTRAKAVSRLGHMGSKAVPAIPFLIAILGDDEQFPLYPEGYGSPGWWAVDALVRRGEVAVEPLIAALTDPHPHARRNAADALGQLKDQRAVLPLVRLLEDKDEDVRRAAVEALGELKDPRAIDPLIQAMKDSSETVAAGASFALGEMGRPAVSPLITALEREYENPEVRADAAWQLGWIGDPRGVDPLLHALKDEEVSIRRSTAVALGRLKDVRAVEPLIEALQDVDPTVRRNAAESLGVIGDPRAIDSLMTTLKDDDQKPSLGAAHALIRIGDPGTIQPAVMALVKAMKCEDGGIRFRASWMLEKVNDPLAVEPLIAALGAENPVVRKDVVAALRRITGKRFGEDPMQWRTWWQKSQQKIRQIE